MPQALQREVHRILGKSTWELVDSPGPGLLKSAASGAEGKGVGGGIL